MSYELWGKCGLIKVASWMLQVGGLINVQ